MSVATMQATTEVPIETSEDDAEILALLDLTTTKRKKSKKSKNKTTSSTHAHDNSGNGNGGSGGNGQKPEPYQYACLLDRVYTTLYDEHPHLRSRGRQGMPAFQVTRASSKTVLWSNFTQVCAVMNRSPQHVLSFITADLVTSATMDASHRLTLLGRHQEKTLQAVVKKYMLAYVTCQMCRSGHTDIVRDPVSRLSFLSCHDCGAARSVAAISQGYVAVNRDARRAARAAAQS